MIKAKTIEEYFRESPRDEEFAIDTRPTVDLYYNIKRYTDRQDLALIVKRSWFECVVDYFVVKFDVARFFDMSNANYLYDDFDMYEKLADLRRDEQLPKF